MGRAHDPFGHRWYLRPPASATRLRQGDVANVTLLAPDAQRVRGLYAAVLQVPSPPLIRGCGGPRRLRLRSVSSRRASEERSSCRTASTTSPLRSSGSGRPAAADEPSRRRFGLLAECTDDQGTTFRLWQPID